MTLCAMDTATALPQTVAAIYRRTVLHEHGHDTDSRISILERAVWKSGTILLQPAVTLILLQYAYELLDNVLAEQKQCPFVLTPPYGQSIDDIRPNEPIKAEK
ncbi:hypothetical protein J6590_061219 [Homalodisca vitripennis]|nr:hypothetical protein J6590_061219 [Homalodisca vitripennis]